MKNVIDFVVPVLQAVIADLFVSAVDFDHWSWWVIQCF